MTKFSKPLLGIALVLALGAQPALAQKKDKTPPAPAPAATAAVTGIGVANLEAAVVNSDAFRLAGQQRPVSYKAYYDQAEARAKQIDAQLKPMADKFEADRAAKKPEAVLVPQVQAIQQLQERGKQEIQQILMPVALSEAYVTEQVEDKLDAAVQAAMTKKGVSIVLQPGAVVARANSYEMTPAIIAELNALIPTAQLAPPQGWLPRQLREQQARQQAAQQGTQPGAAAPAAQPAPRPAQPAGPQPDGR